MSEIPEYLFFWGKSRTIDGVLDSHPAVLHMLDVAAVARAWLLANKPTIPGLGSWDEQNLPILLVLVALHDIGKFSRPFQAKVPRLWPESLGPIDARSEPRHDVAGYKLLEKKEIAAYFAHLLPDLDANDTAVIWRAICGHHGRPPSEDPIDRRAFCPVSCSAALAFISDLVLLLKPLPLQLRELANLTAFSWWLAGLTVLSDWIGSAETWFDYPVKTSNLADYWPKACLKAESAIQAVGLAAIPPTQSFGYEALIGSHAPTPLQNFIAKMELPGGPLLVLIEDQMGSGKTEAAFMLAYRLMLTNRAAGLFIALPTMATANALFDRLAHTYRALFAVDTEPSLVLAHGKRHLSDRFEKALRQPRRDADLVRNDADETASAQCAAWIADDRRRSFLAACGAGTIDQALLAVLPSRHAPLRLFGLSQRVLIIDEAHAYDEYVTEEMRRLIEFQARQGGCTIVLSATLPRQTRQALLGAFGNKNLCHKTGYPLITVASRTDLQEYELPPRPGLERCIELYRLDNMAGAVSVVRDAAARGVAVGWVRNTVDDAIEAQAALAALGVDATLFHARFAMGDRLRIEENVQVRFGKRSEPHQRAHVVVGTQVMEQSLDIDFDVLISDLAPIDLMLQRAGRLWRHDRPARMENVARLYIISPPPVAEPDIAWLSGFKGTAAVYDDPALLWRSAIAIFAKPLLNLPGDVRGMVEAVYAPDGAVPDGLSRRTEAAAGKGMAARGLAWQNLLKWDDGYAQTGGAWASEASTPTRLTDPSFTYRLAIWADGVLSSICTGGKAWAMSELALPMRRVHNVPDEVGPRAAALANLKAGWSRWEQDVRVLILEAGEKGFTGEVIEPSGERRKIIYNQKFGLLWNESILDHC